MTSASGGHEGPPRLLVRDLEQLASPRGGRTPLRGGALRDVDVTVPQAPSATLADGSTVTP